MKKKIVVCIETQNTGTEKKINIDEIVQFLKNNDIEKIIIKK